MRGEAGLIGFAALREIEAQPEVELLHADADPALFDELARDAETVGDLVHGGAIASLVDIAATAACWASRTVKPASRGTTVGFTIHYLAPARGQDLLADARVIQRGSSICFVEVEVLGSDATLVSRATVTYKLSAPR